MPLKRYEPGLRCRDERDAVGVMMLTRENKPVRPPELSVHPNQREPPPSHVLMKIKRDILSI